MKEIIIILNILMFVINTFATNDWIYGLTNQGWIASAYINSTNLVVKYPPLPERKFMVHYDRWDYTINSCCYSPKHNEEVIITTNRISSLSDGYAGVGYDFTPVVFTNQLIGFRIDYSLTVIDQSLPEGFYSTNNVWYVALSDTPVEVGEEDVEGELDITPKQPLTIPDPNAPYYDPNFDWNW